MPEPLQDALDELRGLLLAPTSLVLAVASGRRKGEAAPAKRVELRPVTVRGQALLQLVRDDGVRPYTQNLAWGEPVAAVVDALLAEPFGNWFVRTEDQTIQLRVTKRGEAQLHRVKAGPGTVPPPRDTDHDRAASHLLAPSDPLFEIIGGSAAKRRQVDAFLRALVATLGDRAEAGDGEPSRGTPLEIADLGCGNAYLTFAAYRYLSSTGLDVRITGIDVRDDQRQRNTELAERLGYADRVRFLAGTIADVNLERAPNVVLALHACDTATDEALARAVRWGAKWILTAPCCHHDIAAQLRRHPPAPPNRALVRDGILRERFADVLTDALRANLLREVGYHVEIVEFVGSQHTPRNMLLKARLARAGSPAERLDLAEFWGVTPALATMLSRTPDSSGLRVSDSRPGAG